MKQIKLPYGKNYKLLIIPNKNVISILGNQKIAANENPTKLLIEKLENPIGTDSLAKLIKRRKPKHIVVILSDNTRPFPHKNLLKVLVEKLYVNGTDNANLRFVISNGTHRKMKKSEMVSRYGNWAVKNFRFENHNCLAKNLVSYGKMKTGNELRVNKTVANSDFLITIGIIAPHYFAGFGGGRKSILPGICGYETIRENHSNIIHSSSQLGKLNGNYIHSEMVEAAHLVGVDFSINAILNHEKKVVDYFIGNIDTAFHEGVKAFENLFSTKFEKLADVVFTSPGGFYKDRNFYLSQRTLNNTIQLIKNGGTIVIVTECREGIGQNEMENALTSAKNLDELFSTKQENIQIGEHRAFATGKLLKKADILVVSKMKPKKVRKIHFTSMNSLAQCIKFIEKKHSKNFLSYIVPNGSVFLPTKIDTQF